MPALVLFGRRWNIGSDDFVIPSFIDLIIRLSWLIVLIVIYWQDEEKFDCSSAYYIKFYYYGFFAIAHLIIVLDVFLLESSRRGSIMETEARKQVPLILYLRILAEMTSLGWNVLGVYWLWTDMFVCPEAPVPSKYIQWLVIFNFVLLLLQLIFFLYCYDPLGGSKSLFYPLDIDDRFSVFDLDFDVGATKYTRHWEKRCKRFCCSCTSKSSTGETGDAFREIGRIFGSELAEDLVNSDIVVGLFLLNLKRKQEKRALRMRSPTTYNVVNVVNEKIIAEEPSKRTSVTTIYNFENGDDWRSPKFLFQYVKYACAAYGWIFVPPKRLWNSCICCSCLPKRNYRYPQKVEGDNCCLCCTSGVRDLNRIEFEDIAHVTFRNKLFENPFFVAVDHKTSSVVLSIRGTLSLHDVMMDMAGWPIPIPGYPETFKGHHGMLIGAQNLKRKLDNLEMIQKLLATNPGYNLVVTGQSLGAGLATLVSLLLRPEHPNLKCYAFSPPGGLLSREAAEYCNDFVISVIYGHDVISRLGVLQFERLKFRIMNVLKDCKVPKYRILLGGMFCCLSPAAINLQSLESLDDPEHGSLEPEPEPDSYANFETVIDSESELSHTTTTTVTSTITDCDNSKFIQGFPQSKYPSIQGMYPPGQIFYIMEIPKVQRTHAKAKWTWRWADRTEFDDIVVSNKMIWDHIPIKMPKCLRHLAKSES